jgi:hypothetical protein
VFSVDGWFCVQLLPFASFQKYWPFTIWQDCRDTEVGMMCQSVLPVVLPVLWCQGGTCTVPVWVFCVFACSKSTARTSYIYGLSNFTRSIRELKSSIFDCARRIYEVSQDKKLLLMQMPHKQRIVFNVFLQEDSDDANEPKDTEIIALLRTASRKCRLMNFAMRRLTECSNAGFFEIHACIDGSSLPTNMLPRS